MTLLSRLRTQLIAVAVLVAGFILPVECYAISGQVVDKVSNQPIAGALVAVSWNASSYGHQCLHIEVATTDADGRYRIGNWMGPWYAKYLVMTDKFVSYEAYKLGYANVGDLLTTEDKILLTPFTGTKSAWMKSWGNGGFFCLGNKDGSESNLSPIISSIAADMEAIAETDYQRDIAEFIRRRADELAGRQRGPSGDRAGATAPSRAGIAKLVTEPKWAEEVASPSNEPQPTSNGSSPRTTLRLMHVETPLSTAPERTKIPTIDEKP